jgi:hypothetical protein
VGNSEVHRPLRSPRYRWVYNIKIDHRKIVWGGMNLIRLAQDREKWRAVVNTVMNIRVV